MKALFSSYTVPPIRTAVVSFVTLRHTTVSLSPNTLTGTEPIRPSSLEVVAKAVSPPLFRHCGDARVYGNTTTAIRDMSTTPRPPYRAGTTLTASPTTERRSTKACYDRRRVLRIGFPNGGGSQKGMPSLKSVLLFYGRIVIRGNTNDIRTKRMNRIS